MFTIKLIEGSTGKPIEGIKLGIIFHGVFRGVAKDRWTDSDGEATFTERNGIGSVYVNGMEVYEGELEGKKMIYL
jgi:hypothetical protein